MRISPLAWNRISRGVIPSIILWAWFSCTSTSIAALYAYFPLDAISSGTTANLAPGGVAGVIHGAGITAVNDPTRGLVLNSTGGSFIDAGSTVAFSDTSDHTWSFWAKSTGGPVNAVIIGNRGDGNGTPNSGDDSRWIKFSKEGVNWNVGGGQFYVYYPALTNSEPWVHHALVKTGTTLNYYRNGVLIPELSMTMSVAQASTGALTFQLFGDEDYSSERWAGSLDDVALFSHALSAAEIAGLYDGTFTPLTVPEPSVLGLTMVSLILVSFRRRRG